MTETDNDSWSENEFGAVLKAEPEIKIQSRRAVQSRSDLYQVLHDANQPLAVIIGLAELGLYTGDPDLQPDFNTILEEARKLKATLLKARDIAVDRSGNYAIK